jgi:HK97 family phage major capsid protein
MEKKELTDALAEHGKAIELKQSEMQTAIEKKMTESADALKKEIEGMEDTRKKMQDQLDKLDIEIQKSKKQPSEKVKTFADELRESLNKEIDELAKLKEVGARELKLQVKTFLETNTNSITTGDLIPWPQLDPGVSKAPDRMPFMLELVSRGVANSMTIYWVQRKTRTDKTEFVDEGAAPSGETVLGYETKSASMQNLSSYLKVSNNSLDDIDWLLSEIQTELVTLHLLKLDAEILNAESAVEGFDGVYTAATAFAAGGDTLPAGVTPNKFDALAYALNQVKVANFNPTTIVLHPSDLRDLKLTRDDNGNYMLPPTMAVGNNVAVDGVRVVSNTGMTKGSYLVGDFTRAKFWTRKGMELRIWEQHDEDAVKQLKTVTLYSRGTLIIKDADKLAFVKDTFADTITEITAGA